MKVEAVYCYSLSFLYCAMISVIPRIIVRTFFIYGFSLLRIVRVVVTSMDTHVLSLCALLI